jgi:hypothetical protein
MQLLDLTPGHEAVIPAYESHGAYALPLGEGRGEGHIHCIRIEPGGIIGPHEAGFGQLFLGGGGQWLGQRRRWSASATGRRAGGVYRPRRGSCQGQRHRLDGHYGATDGLGGGTDRARRLTRKCSRQAGPSRAPPGRRSPMAISGT